VELAVGFRDLLGSLYVTAVPYKPSFACVFRPRPTSGVYRRS